MPPLRRSLWLPFHSRRHCRARGQAASAPANLWQTGFPDPKDVQLISPFEWFVGMRYTRAGRGAGQRNGFISFIAALSVAGIALGVAALIVVLSVMNGFQ